MNITQGTFSNMRNNDPASQTGGSEEVKQSALI